MKNQSATAAYALIHAMLWSVYGFLFSYANPYLTERLSFSDTQAGLILGIATALSFALQPLLTSVVDRTRLNVKNLSTFCALLTAACAALTLLHPGENATMLLFAASCVCLQVLPSFANALGMEGIRGGRSVNFGVARGVGSVCFGVSARLASPLISAMGMDAVALSGAVSAAMLALAIAVFPNNPLSADRSDAEKPTTARVFFKEEPKFLVLLLGVILLYIGHNVLSNCMYRIAESKLADAVQDAVTEVQGTALLIAAVAELPMMFLFTKLVKKVRCDVCLLISAVFMSLRILLTLVLPTATGLYAAQLSQALGYALFAVASVYYVGSVVAEKNVVKGQTYLGACNTFGCLLAYVLGGSLIDSFGVENMLLTCAVLSVLGVACLRGGVREVKQTVGTGT